MIFGNLGNMGEMMKMAKDMQGKLKQMKQELSHEIFESSDKGVTIKVSGDMEIKELRLSPELVGSNDIIKIEKAILEVSNKALKDAKDGAAGKMKGITGGLGLPGMF